MQERIGRIELSSALIRGFQPAMVIGLVQTTDYARAMMSGKLSGQTLELLTRSRRERQAILDTDRQFTLLHAEGALRWHIGSPTIMAAQLDYLVELTRRPNLRLGVIPWDRTRVRAGRGGLPGLVSPSVTARSLNLVLRLALFKTYIRDVIRPGDVR